MKIIYGPKGTGKTKIIIDSANEMLESAKGHIVYITDSKKNPINPSSKFFAELFQKGSLDSTLSVITIVASELINLFVSASELIALLLSFISLEIWYLFS